MSREDPIQRPPCRRLIEEADVVGETGGGEQPTERVPGQIARVEEPIGRPVQGEFGRRASEGEEDRVRIAPDDADNGFVRYEGGHGITANSGGRRGRRTPGWTCVLVEPR